MARRLIQNYEISAALNEATAADGANIRHAKGTDAFDEFCINLTAGSVRVFASLDGTNYMAKQLVLCQEPPNTGDTITAQDPVFVGVVTANVPAWFYGNYKSIRLQQVGGTQPVGFLSASGEKP